MKALTLTQPWASLVAHGLKCIETRSWGTSFRGPLAIHAARRIPKEYDSLWLDEPFLSALHSVGIVSISPSDLLAVFGGGTKYQLHADKLYLGCVIATCKLARIDRIGDGYWKYITRNERAFGDYTTGRFAWILEDIQLLPEPIPARGALGLWDWDEQG